MGMIAIRRDFLERGSDMVYRLLSGLVLFQCFLLIVGSSGCVSSSGSNGGQLESFSFMLPEAEWIRNGDPIEYDGKLWYPQDETENLIDSEVYLLGEYRGVQFFIEKIDVKPYDRIYTKFSRNRFRYFQQKTVNE